jgi:hypothetical protein
MLCRHTQFPHKDEVSSWVLALVTASDSKLRLDYEVIKHFTVLMARRGKG